MTPRIKSIVDGVHSLDEQRGVCCACGYRGDEETTCSVRKDQTHCVHWWEGDEDEQAEEEAP